jgi:hypothetical protein
MKTQQPFSIRLNEREVPGGGGEGRGATSVLVLGNIQNREKVRDREMAPQDL